MRVGERHAAFHTSACYFLHGQKFRNRALPARNITVPELREKTRGGFATLGLTIAKGAEPGNGIEDGT
jgi:hypothetical protein